MALTGLFLISFLVIHVGLNSCIFNDLPVFDPTDDGRMFNKAAHFMGSSVVIRIIEIGLFIGFIIHIIQGYVLAGKNLATRSVGYRVKNGFPGQHLVQQIHGFTGHIIIAVPGYAYFAFLGPIEGYPDAGACCLW